MPMIDAPARTRPRARSAASGVAAWTAALMLVTALFVLLGYHSRDPDSALHAAIVVQSYQRPVAEWIAPSWGGEWQRTDLYREHPAGIFFLPSVLARAGFPAPQAAFAVNALYQILTILLIVRFAALIAPAAEARALGWILLLLPIAFTYRIRANHEQAVLLLTVLALHGAERARHRVSGALEVVLAAVLTFLAKGVFVVPVLVTAGVWLALRPPDRAHRGTSWGGVALAAVATVAAAAAYEHLYRRVTGGETFLGFYLRQQLGLAAVSAGGGAGAVVARKLANLAWYGGRLLWYAAPWSVLLVAELAAMVRRRASRGAGAASLLTAPSRQRDLLPVLAAALVWPLMFSLSDRCADRYIFPAYFLLGGAGAAAGLHQSARLRQWVRQAERLFPFEHVVIWVALTLLSLAAWLTAVPGRG